MFWLEKCSPLTKKCLPTSVSGKCNKDDLEISYPLFHQVEFAKDQSNVDEQNGKTRKE